MSTAIAQKTKRASPPVMPKTVMTVHSLRQRAARSLTTVIVASPPLRADLDPRVMVGPGGIVNSGVTVDSGARSWKPVEILS